MKNLIFVGSKGWLQYIVHWNILMVPWGHHEYVSIPVKGSCRVKGGCLSIKSQKYYGARETLEEG